MENSHSASYAAAGVNIEAGYEGVRLMKKHVERTMIPGVVSDIGGFGGLFMPNIEGMKEPTLVMGTDGVGTKQRIAQLMDKHDTVGIDCVAMCVNDIVCCGAKPITFLDYIAIGKNEPEKVATLVSGVAEGCVQAGCALIGGETAEHPGTMAADDYDLAGFAVGIVDKTKVVDLSTSCVVQFCREPHGECGERRVAHRAAKSIPNYPSFSASFLFVWFDGFDKISVTEDVYFGTTINLV